MQDILGSQLGPGHSSQTVLRGKICLMLRARVLSMDREISLEMENTWKKELPIVGVTEVKKDFEHRLAMAC